MAKYRSGSILGRVFSVLMGALLLVGLFALFWWLSDGVWGALPTFTVTTGGHKYCTDKTDVRLYPGTEFDVDSFFGKKYTLKIEANADSSDFRLTVNGEVKKWSDYTGKDFTAGFQIEKQENKYTVSYSTLTDVCAVALGQPVEITDTVQGDVFDVVITCGKREVRLSCYINQTEQLPDKPAEQPGDQTGDQTEAPNVNQGGGEG